ncbi:MAG: hypothetical protein QM479_14925 [Pseudomonadota bacterium]
MSSSIQMDNRYSPSNQLSADILATYAYDDANNDLHSRLNFLMQASEYSFQQGNALYEMSIEKGWSEYHSQVKAGRFERADNLGFYFLDGLNLTYRNKPQDLGFEVYMGKPGRIDDIRSIEGDYLFGFELFNQFKTNVNNKLLPQLIDSWDFRFGLQKIKNKVVAHRFNLALNTQGINQQQEKQSACQLNCQFFKSQMLLTYHIEEQKIEDLYVDLRLAIQQDLRLRLAYEYYQPEIDLNPGFREQFYSYYAFGDQKLTKINVDYFFNNQMRGFIEGIYSNREIGDEGLGYAAGVTIKNPLANRADLDVTLSLDRVKLGENKLHSFYISLEQHINSRLNIQLDGIYRKENKFHQGENSVFGLNGKMNYMAKNNLILSFEAREIKNSKLRNEHMLRFSMTYYFDNYKTKTYASKFSQNGFSGI